MDDKSALFLFKKNAVNSVNLKYNALCVRVGRRIESGLIVFNAIKSARQNVLISKSLWCRLDKIVISAFVCSLIFTRRCVKENARSVQTDQPVLLGIPQAAARVQHS